MRAHAAAATLALLCLAMPACESCLEDCQPGVSRACYLVEDASAGVGVCVGGQQTCQSNGAYGPCEAAGEPGVEICDGLDNDCDGVIDEKVANACGGCSRLELAPNTPCGLCGAYACDGGEAVSCADPDPDLDGYHGACDNCPDVYNPDQADSDGNGVGDACEPTG